MGERTTIEVDTETRTRLRTWKSRRDMTYDEAINALLDGGVSVEEQPGGEPVEARGRDGGEPVECHSCGYSWTYTGSTSRPTCPDCGNKTPLG